MTFSFHFLHFFFLRTSKIRVVEEARFLGLLFEKRVTCPPPPDIRQLQHSRHKPLDLLHHYSHTSWNTDRKTLLRPYKSLFSPNLKPLIYLLNHYLFPTSITPYLILSYLLLSSLIFSSLIFSSLILSYLILSYLRPPTVFISTETMSCPSFILKLLCGTFSCYFFFLPLFSLLLLWGVSSLL